ncbi:MAG: hypothetical protein J6W52_00670 [Bacteroidaceae bacterium]|nr:hypothetical protein [Bacteroidaceae bacterium]
MSKKTKQKRGMVPPPKAEVADKKGRNIKLPLWLLPILYSVAFVVLAWVFLVGKNADTLFFMQDRGYWNDSMVYFHDCMRMPGGFLSWVGSYLTQYFYYPACGAAMLILLWMLCFCVAWRSFHVRLEWTFLLFVPLLALLCTVVQLGYWIYFLRDIDFSFYYSLGLLSALLLSVDYTSRLRYGPQVQIIAVAVLFYYPLGIYALVASALVGIRMCCNNWRKGWQDILLAALVCAVVPLLETSGSTLMRPEQPWTFGLKCFEIGPVRDYGLELPFVIACLSPMLFPLLTRRKDAKVGTRVLVISQLLMVAVAVGAYNVISARNCDDSNYHAEFRMLRAVDEGQWDDVLNEARAAKENPSRLMVMYRDIALMNKGELLNRYQYNNRPAKPSMMSDSVVVRLCDTTGDFIYYNFGETCFGIRRAIERSMHFGFSYYTLRVLARCALVNGEYDAVRKYQLLLEHSTFHKKWARELQPYLDDTTRIASSPRFGLVKRLYNGGSSMVGTDDYFVEPTLIHKLAHTATDNPEILELALAYCLQDKDPRCFWAQVWQYDNLFPGKPFPRYVQEAMLLFHYELKTGPEDLSAYHIDPQILQRYNAFINQIKGYAQSGMSADQIGAMLQPLFGDTYWWDYCVLKEIKSY